MIAKVGRGKYPISEDIAFWFLEELIWVKMYNLSLAPGKARFFFKMHVFKTQEKAFMVVNTYNNFDKFTTLPTLLQ